MKALKIVVSRAIGLLVFLLMLAIANLVAYLVRNPVLSEIVYFINVNVFHQILIAVFMGAGEVFFSLSFPFNLPAPVFSAVGGVLLVSFIFKIFRLIDSLIGADIFRIFWPLALVISVIVFLGVLIGGYASIFSGFLRPAPVEPKRRVRKH